MVVLAFGDAKAGDAGWFCFEDFDADGFGVECFADIGDAAEGGVDEAGDGVVVI